MTDAAQRRSSPRREWSDSALSALRIVAALGHVRVHDIPAVFADRVSAERGLAEGALSLRGGALWPADDSTATEALENMTDSARCRLHERLAECPLSEFTRAQQRDLAHPPGHDRELADDLESLARKAEQTGQVEISLDLWLRSLARAARPSDDRFDRVVGIAHHADAIGDFPLAYDVIAGLDFESLSVEQCLRAVSSVGKTLYQMNGVEMARLRLTQLRDTLPASHVSRIVFEVHLAGLHDHYGLAQQELESALIQLTTKRAPVELEHSALSMLLEARANTGVGLDQSLLDRMRLLEVQRADLPLAETADAVEAYLGHQTGDPALTQRLAPSLIVRAEGEGNRAYQDVIRVHAALADIELGQFTRAEAHLAQSRALKLGKDGSPAAVRAHGLLALERGDDDAFRKALARPHTGGREAVGHYSRLGLQGLCLARAGDHAAATRLLQECLVWSSRLGIEEPARRMSVEVQLGISSARSGDLETARDMVRRLVARAERPNGAVFAVQAQRIGAWIARFEGDDRARLNCIRDMVSIAPRVTALPERGRMLADALDLASSAVPGAPLATEIWHQVASVMRLLEDGVVRRDLTRRAHRRDNALHADLTDAQMRVMNAVCRGLSNKEVSESLFLSPRTVESHLSTIYRKLGLTSRSQLISLVNSLHRS